MKKRGREQAKSRDYTKADMAFGGRIFLWGKGVLLTAALSGLFYKSLWGFFALFPLAVLYVKREKLKYMKIRQKRLCRQFKDGLTVLLSSLEAGYSVENAFADANTQLRQMYQQETDIEAEFLAIKAGLEMNENIEALLTDFADRSGIDDIKGFAEIFIIVKRRGGDMVVILKSSIRMIQEKIEVEQDIDTMIAGKRLEQTVMSFVPVGILLYVNLTSPDFLAGLYGNLTGACVMSGCLILYILAFLLGEKITGVEV